MFYSRVGGDDESGARSVVGHCLSLLHENRISGLCPDFTDRIADSLIYFNLLNYHWLIQKTAQLQLMNH